MPPIFALFACLFLLSGNANAASVKELNEQAFQLQKQAASIARKEYEIRQRIISDLKIAEKTTLAAARMSRLPTGALAGLDDVQTSSQRAELIKHLEKQIAIRINSDRENLAELLATMKQQKAKTAELKKALGSRAKKLSSMQTLDEIFANTGSIYIANKNTKAHLPQGIKIIQPFGKTNKTGTQTQGITFKTTAGSPIPALKEGKVIYSGEFRNLGNLVILDHGNKLFTLYGHLSSNDMPSVGTKVNTGNTLAYAPHTNEPEIYIEARKNNHTINPLKLQ